MEGKYAVKLSITDLIKISRKWRKLYNGHLWNMLMWSDSRRALSLYWVTDYCRVEVITVYVSWPDWTTALYGQFKQCWFTVICDYVWPVAYVYVYWLWSI